MAEDYDMIKDDNSTGGGPDPGMDELQFDDIDSMLSAEPESSAADGLEDLTIESDPLESMVASSGEDYTSDFESDFSFHPEETETPASDLSLEDSLDLELTDPLIDAEIDKLLDIGDLSDSGISRNSNLETDDSFFSSGDIAPDEGMDFSELDSYLTEEPDAISFGEEMDDLEEFGLSELDDEGPISLHEDDLQGVKPDFSLQDFSMEDEHREELDHGDLSFDEDDFLSEEEGPITLSESELGEIVSSEEPLPDFSSPSADSEEEDITLSGSELDGILGGDELPGTDDFSASTFDENEEDGPISLSGNELDDILNTGDESPGTEEISASKIESEDLPDFITHTDFQDEEDDNEPIALSDDELGHLLADDSGEEGNGPSEVSFDSETPDHDLPTRSEFYLEEEEEPISLSLEELDHIQSEGDALDETPISTEDEFALAEESLSDSTGFSFEPGDTFSETEEEEDEEPIALSEEELGNLLSDDSDSSESSTETTEGFSDLLDGGELPEDSGSMFGESADFGIPDEQDLGDLGEPDGFGLSEDSLSSDAEEFSPDSENDPFSDSETEEDGEPIALSEEELGNLLSSDSDEEEPAAASSLFDENVSQEDSISLPVEELDGIGEDSISLDEDSLSFEEFDLPTNDLDSLETPVSSDSTLDETEMEDGPIALSDDELGNLLASDDIGGTDSSFDFEPQTASESESDEEDASEPIALSLDELDHILTDDAEPEAAAEFPVADSEIDWDAPLSSEDETFESEDEDTNEPIALSSDELDHILGDESSETATDATFPGADAEIDWDAPVSEQAEVPLEDEEPIALSSDELDHILTGEEDSGNADEDEGPIALSEDELGNLLADSPVAEEGQDLNEILGELPPVSDLDAFDSIDDDVAGGISPVATEIVPTAETVSDEEMVIVLDEYADEDELSPVEELRKTPDQIEVGGEEGQATPSKDEMKRIMTYLDELLGNLPDDLIREFSRSDYFELYKKLMKQIGV
ncbi:hypothetical protein [Leptospira ellisii]|nr:hypothetical protein [Leptospira ellisii]PJZ93510.1 hypothetical protein CH379_07515 [Leptospira ellisii]